MFLVPLVVFFGVKFGFQKSCQCKRNDKYEVCSDLRRLPTSLFCDISWWVFIWYFFKRPPAQTSTYRTCYWHRSSESKITPSASLSLQRLRFKLHWLGLLSSPLFYDRVTDGGAENLTPSSSSSTIEHGCLKFLLSIRGQRFFRRCGSSSIDWAFCPLHCFMTEGPPT